MLTKGEEEEGRLLVVSLNTNMFASNVQDALAQHAPASHQLNWLERTLQNDTSQQGVVIIGHHPPGISLFSLYNNEAAKANWKLVYFERFRSICSAAAGNNRIVGMFFGHEHQDSFAVEEEDAAAAGITGGSSEKLAIFSIPSVSPVYQGQPSYSVAQLNPQNQQLQDLTTYHTWLDFYTRTGDTPQFFSYQSVGGILRVEELSFETLSNAAQTIIEQSGGGMKTCLALKNRIYQGRYVPTLPPHLHYCYSTTLRVSSFIACIEKYGYDGKKYIVNG